MTTRIFISAGEASGDQLAAALVKAVKEKNAEIQFTGMGDQKMEAAGVQLILDAKKVSIVGITEVFKHLFTIYRSLKTIQRYLKNTRPNLVILVDLPDFNFRVARYAKKYHIPVLYYVSPQIWAWRASRIHTLKKYVSHMAVLFEFEKSLYEKAGIPVTVVGHPLVDQMAVDLDKQTVCEKLKLNPKQPIIGLFPGSRAQEITRLLPKLLETVKWIQKTLPEAQFLLPVAHTLQTSDIAKQVPNFIAISTLPLSSAIKACDAALAVSGTITLEIALQQVPLTLFYQTSTLTFLAAKILVKTPFIGLCNIVAKEEVAREFIQKKATAPALAQEIIALLQDATYREKRLKQLAKMPQHLGHGGGAQKTAQLVLQQLDCR